VAEREQLRIGVIGAGRLGASLAVALARAGYHLTAVAGRDPAAAERLAGAMGPGVLAAPSPAGLLANADLVFLTVPDAAIEGLSAALPWEPGHMAVHCSGALGLDALLAASRAGAATGCFHPLQSFPSREPEPARFRGIVCGVEGREPLGGLLEGIAGDLGAGVVRLEGIDRAVYHAAAVLASNCLVGLAAAASRAWALAGLPPESARAALGPLLLAVARNINAVSLEEALTGPVARGDVATVEAHLAALARDPALAALYRELGAELLRIAPVADDHARARLLALLG
jgi:predicted short-subunit dehydrogenase-like oxidoreductase (DUF2520 family)